MAKFLHWTIAAVFLVQYCVIYGRHWFTDEDTPASWALLQMHQAIGISVMVFVLWRIVWRLAGVRPAPADHPKWVRTMASLVHGALYFFMISMPITGYLYAGNETVFFGAFEIPAFGDTAVANWILSTWDLAWKEGIREPMRDFHREFAGETVLWLLILIHAGAALYHHYVARDDVLLRMLPDRLRQRMNAPL